MKFYILSLKHQRNDRELCFWAPDRKGYTTNLLDAGVYRLEQVLAAPAYLHGGANSLAVGAEALPNLAAELRTTLEPGLRGVPRVVVQVVPHADVLAEVRRRQCTGEVLVQYPGATVVVYAPLQKMEAEVMVG